MTLRWPDTLPGASMPGFGLSPLDPNIRTNMEVGQQKVRRRTFYRIDRVSAAWRMKDAEMKAFRAWVEGLPYSLSGASDDLSVWARTNATLSVGAAVSPDGVIVDSIRETAILGQHRVSATLTGAAVDNAVMVLSATIRAVGRPKARLSIVDRASVFSAADIDLTTGAITSTTGVISSASSDRGGGWWRITVNVTTGTGTATPLFRILPIDSTGVISYTGDVTKGLDICETQARLFTGYDLFVATDASGNAMGANGGSAWFWMNIAAGGGFTLAETRFTGPYKAVASSGLNWDVTAEVEVRNA